MKAIPLLTIVLLLATTVRGVEPAKQLPRITSLHGTLIVMLNDEEGIEFEIWAKGNNLRSEYTSEKGKIVNIQLDNALYTFTDGSSEGTEQLVQLGLGAKGLVTQIEEVKARGSVTGEQEINGVLNRVYSYEVDAPAEMAVVYLSVETSLPTFWISIVQTSETEAVGTRMLYRDMEANIAIDDEMFTLPMDVQFNIPSGKVTTGKLAPLSEDLPGVIDERTLVKNDNLVVVVTPGAKVLSDDHVVGICRLGDVLSVARKSDNRLLVMRPDFDGWISTRDVVLFNDAHNYFSREIQRDPRNADALSGRGFFLTWLAQNTTQIPEIEKADSKLLIEQAADDFGRAAQLVTRVDVLVGRGLTRTLRDDHKGALADFNAALEMDSEHAEALRHRALTFVKLNNYDEAIADCDRLLSLNAKDDETHSLRCLALGLKGEWDKALLECNTAIDINPRLASAYMRRGTIWAGKGDDTKAKSNYDQAIRLGDDSARAIRARILIKQGELKEAIADLNAALKLDPERAEYYFTRGTVFLKLDEVDAAIADLSRAIELEPNASTYLNRGVAWATKNELSKAQDDFSAAMRLDIDLPDSYLNRGRLLVQLADYQGAIADLTEYIRRVPDNAEAYLQRGMASHFSGSQEAAIEDASRSIEFAPNNPQLYVFRGSVWNQQQDFDLAIIDFSRAIALNPDSAEAYTYRGVAWHQQGEAEKALADFDAAVKIDDTFEIAHINRGSYWLSKQNYGKAIADFRVAIDLNPNRAVVLNELAWIQATAPNAEFRNADQAQMLAERACELTDWENAEFLSTLAAAYAESGDYQAAVKWQTESMRLATDDYKAESERRLKQLKSKQPLRDVRKPTDDH